MESIRTIDRSEILNKETMTRWKSFEGKTVLITGASSGIGLAMANEFAKRKANLILVARSENKLQEIAASIRKKERHVAVIAMDLSEATAAEKLYETVNKKGLNVDLLINNAGYGRWGRFDDYGRPDYNKMIQLNIATLTELCHLFLPNMVKRNDGGIINVASVAAFGPVPYGNVYSATKAFVLTFTEALNYEYKDQGIHTMALCPGATESKFMEVATEKSTDVRENAQKRAASMNFLSSETVAKDCLNSFLKGKVYRITGFDNRMMYAISKHLSRKTVLNLIGKMFQRVVKG